MASTDRRAAAAEVPDSLSGSQSHSPSDSNPSDRTRRVPPNPQRSVGSESSTTATHSDRSDIDAHATTGARDQAKMVLSARSERSGREVNVPRKSRPARRTLQGGRGDEGEEGDENTRLVEGADDNDVGDDFWVVVVVFWRECE